MFTVDPSEIQHFDGLQVVQLLRVLLFAEARKAGVPLRNVDVPLQITIADGGQDAIVKWEGGKASTDYFPGRDIVFQCKATDHGNAQWKKEVWTKKSQSKSVKLLNPAISEVLARGGSYVGVTSTPLVGLKPNDRAKAIADGIRDAAGEPKKLASIEVYDGNKLAEWASSHPAVALWVKEQKAGMPLAGFSTLDQWGKRNDVAKPAFVGGSRTFSLGSNPADTLDFDQLAGRIVDHLSDAQACARIWGASGIGKTRALYEALSTSRGVLRDLTAANFIFCDFRDVSTQIWDVVNQIKNDGSPAVLVVDACSWEDTRRLFDLARAEESQLRVITLGAEGRDQVPDCLSIRPQPANFVTIKGILANGLAKAKSDEIEYIAHLCDGFPRIAVLIASSYRNQSILKSAADVASQIVHAASLERDTVRALEGLSLFEYLMPEGDAAAFDNIAETLVHMPGGMMYEHLIIASEKHLVARDNDQLAAQPRPIADFLAVRRLNYLRASTVIRFLLQAEPAVRVRMLARWRHLAQSQTLIDVVRTMLKRELGSAAQLLSPDTATFLPPFVHVEPDATAVALFWAIIQMPLDDLAAVRVTDELLGALSLLASRQDSFRPAAQMVLRLAAVAESDGPQPVLDLLRQLFQVALAGTQADDRGRRDALADLDDKGDPRIMRAYVEALGAMLQTSVSRTGDFEQVGTEPFRAEWNPSDQATILAYFDWALARLLEVWREFPDLRQIIQEHVASELRSLLIPELLQKIETLVDFVVDANGYWFEATRSVGQWLYFDRPDPPTEFSFAVRRLYDRTLPTQSVEQALLFSRFWTSDLHDPDTRYAEQAASIDFEYSSRRARALAPEIARDPAKLARVIDAMSTEEMNGPHALAEELAAQMPDPLGAMTRAVAALDGSSNQAGIGFVLALLAGLDRRLAEHPDDVAKLEAIAASSPTLAASPMNIHTALRVTDERLGRLTQRIRGGEIDTAHAAAVSYGRGLAGVSTVALSNFVEALVESEDQGGAWVALEVLSMVTHDLKELPAELSKLVKLALLAPSIAEQTGGYAHSAVYVYDRMMQLLATSKEIDAAFGRSFALQIERSCRSVGGKRGRSSNALRSGLATVIHYKPLEVWAVLSGFYDTGTSVERDRLNAIVAPTKPFATADLHGEPGALFATPMSIMLDWADHDQDARAPFLVSFFPTVEQREGVWSWHPALQRLADRYASSKPFRVALRRRIFPSSWSGSLNPYLARFRTPLAEWISHGSLGDWANATLEAVNRSLDDEISEIET